MSDESAASTLREDEIRPDVLMAEQAERYMKDVRRLLEHSAEFVEVGCPACRSGDRTFRFSKYELAYHSCDSCGTLYISPRPTPELLELYYRTSENYSYWNQFIFPASEDARREKIFRPRAERLAEIAKRNGVGRGVLLEVGAGFGTFCEEIQRLGHFDRVIAVEPTPDLAATCRRKGVEVLESRIEDVEFGADLTVDAVASFEVIEHLFEPRAFLEGIRRVLSPGGVVFLTCPSAAGFDIATLGPLSGAVDTEHLNYFTPGSLSHLLIACGFEVMEIQTPGKLDAELVRKKAVSGELDLSTQPFLKTVLLDSWDGLGDAFQRFLAENGLSSHLWIVARKVS